MMNIIHAVLSFKLISNNFKNLVSFIGYKSFEAISIT